MRRPDQTPVFRVRDISFFLQFVRPVCLTGALALLLSLMTTLLGSLLPLSSKVLIDFIIMKKGFEKLAGILGFVGAEHLLPSVLNFLESLEYVAVSIIAIGILMGLLGLLQRYLMVRFQKEVTFNLQASLFEHLLSVPISFFRKQGTGYLAARVSWDVYALQSLFSSSVIELLTKTSMLIFGVAILFTLSAKLTVILLVILPLYILVNYFFSARIRSVSHREMEATAQVSKDLHEVIAGVETIKSYTTEGREVERVTGTMKAAVQTGIRGAVLSLLSQYSVRGIQLASTVLILWFGAHEIMNRAITIGDYVAFTSYMVLLSGSVNVLSTFHLRLQPLFASLDRVTELFQIIPETARVNGSVLRLLDSVRGEVAFNNVSFDYKESTPVLDNISFTANPGQIIALVGPSGAGKTTLINLLFKFYVPKSGTISLDGHDICSLDTDWIRSKIGVVSQDIFLFNETIENNIKYGNPHATKEDVIGAARRAGIHADIMGFPGKYESVIGERGVSLSAGQRQRLSIARSFLKDPAIYIFDEPVSALDPVTEDLIKESLKGLAGEKTTIIIAHRLSTITIADVIIVMSQGRIVEQGSHPDLLGKRGLYHQLYYSHAKRR